MLDFMLYSGIVALIASNSWLLFLVHRTLNQRDLLARIAEEAQLQVEAMTHELLGRRVL